MTDRFRAFAVIAVLLPFALVASCGGNGEEPMQPSDSSVALHSSPATIHIINSIADFESVWANGGFASGDVFRVTTGTVLDWSTDKRFAETAANNKSFTIEGVDTTAILRKSHSGPSPFFTLTDTGGANQTITIRNIKLERTNGSGTFMHFNGYANINIDNVVMNFGDNYVQLACNVLLTERLDLESASSFGFYHRSNSGQAFSHTIRDSYFRHVSGGGSVARSTMTLAAQGGSLLLENNVFRGTQSDDAYHFSVTGNPADGPDAIDVDLVDNDFQLGTFHIGSCNNVVIAITMANNNSDAEFCAEDLVQCECTEETCLYATTVSTWSFMGDPQDYDDFGPISEQNACYDAGMVYVEFALASTAAFEDYQDVEVEWGDDNCATGGGTVAATWNSTTSKWNASFDVSGIGDADVYWRGKGTLCSKTVVGDCIRRRFTACGAGGIPVWFTQE